VPTDEQLDEVARGAAGYTPLALKVYNLYVVYLSNSVAWRCSRKEMLRQYSENLGPNHLDVGTGTGWYLKHSDPSPDAHITLMDLNENSLKAAANAVRSAGPRTIQADVLQPWPQDLGQFDSIATNFLFHCVPGNWNEKGIAFQHAAKHLKPGGSFFGATVLGQGITHNAIGRQLMALYNRRGVFHNLTDDRDELENQLHAAFETVSVRVHGTVALFVASDPRSQ
jgi:ubiquinone/menaquinone biosynthesis C-methylase UbiE